MKRFIAILACGVLLAGCGSGSDNNQDQGSSSSQQSGQSQSDNKNNGQESGKGENDSESASDSSKSNDAGDEFASKQARQSYALGMNIGNSLKKMPLDVDTDKLAEGVSDRLGDGETKMNEKQVRDEMATLVEKMRASQQKKQKKLASENAEKAKQFLAKNKQKEGVKTTDDGLQYKVLNKGDGPQPDGNDKVTVSYVGKLPNGKVFDSSKKQDKPATFPVNAVIPGWTEGLQMMHEGAKYHFVIPPKLAYGKRGAGELIGPNQVLIFDVTLKKVAEVEGSASDSSQDGDSGVDANSPVKNESSKQSGGSTQGASKSGSDNDQS
ncbi:FKBP-type peptidyl-prolyl cis-trans isomerase [Salinisphaera sp. USBA-960]|uniref:FKBP-type peptidyl-prolyl cis-trans isomerase n=1 Tax=Salinisphaera orenii TaxID=856731 RepID=UPI000DBE0567|nr:FKBP-type peptidyl-prolyl cis-trans isomerase [Salifodinibacter halophilus]NNC26635.1 FKBP-type peptidyl-prolyl cis-trans isomerase [Salifodinibacter halophilus]